MLDLHNILWVIPGLVFINIYNRKKPHETITLSGWPYLFFLVVIAAFAWLPSEWIMMKAGGGGMSPAAKQIITLTISLAVTMCLLLLAQWEPVANMIFAPSQDHFFKKCMEWKNHAVLLTLKNGKTYIGALWKFPENSKLRHESQTISIIPVKSGYRENGAKKSIWNVDYKEIQDKPCFSDMEIIIPRSEIITFRKFNKEVFDYFLEEDKV